jgi:hypothetical protein
MRPTRLLPSLSLILCVACASTQQQPTLDGTWIAEWLMESTRNVAGSGHGQAAKLVIEGARGQWRYLPRGQARRDDPCTGPPAEVEVISASPQDVRVRILGANALRGCPNFGLRLRFAEPGVLEGTFSNGWPVRLARQQ